MSTKTNNHHAARLTITREALGLTSSDLAYYLNVTPEEVHAWETSMDPIPDRYATKISDLERYTAHIIDNLAHKLAGTSTNITKIRIYPTDSALRNTHPELKTLPASWWRIAVYHALTRHPHTPVEIICDTPSPERTIIPRDTFPRVTS